jgi:hypothetical protein
MPRKASEEESTMMAKYSPKNGMRAGYIVDDGMD